MQQNNLKSLGNEIFTQIVSFLDPQSITSLVLVSRETRVIVSESIKCVLKIQLEYYKYQISRNVIYEKTFAQYKKIFDQIGCFSKDDAYKKFMDQLNDQNTHYYKNFFSLVFGKDIKIDSQGFKAQKQVLKEIGSNIYLLLKQMKSSNEIPSYRVQYFQYTDYSVKQTQSIFQFVNQFTRELSILQSIPNISTLYKEFNRTILYLRLYKPLTKLKISTTLYQKRLYYLRGDVSYHSFISHNLNSIIMSFLTVDELQTVSHCDKTLRALIPPTLEILFLNMIKHQEKLKEELTTFPNLTDVYDLYNLMQRYSKVKLEISYIKFLQRANMQIETIKVLFKLLNIKQCDQIQFISKFLSKMNCGVCLYPYIISLDEEQVKILEEYFKNNKEISEIQIISNGHALIHVNLYVCLKMKQNNFSEMDIWNYQAHLNKIKKTEQYILNLSDAIELNSIQHI